MIPEAIHDGRSLVVLPIVAGFLFALYLTVSASKAPPEPPPVPSTNRISGQGRFSSPSRSSAAFRESFELSPDFFPRPA